VPDWIVIENVPPYDGRYEFDLGQRELTTREWGWIKRLAGYLPLDFDQEDKLGDPELITVFAVIALRRAGKVEVAQVPTVFERLIDAPFDGSAIKYESDPDPVEDDAGPPPSSWNGSAASSGPPSLMSSETSALTQSSSGTPASAISESDRPTSVT
jgi:hypothetical protein